MSAFGRIGNLAKDLVGSAASIPHFIWDVATAPWNDNKEFNGVSNTLKTATKNFAIAANKPMVDVAQMPPVAGALDKLQTVNRNVLWEPLTTEFLTANDVASGRIGVSGLFNPDEWKKAYKGAQDISYGQAITGMYKSALDKNFNIYDPKQRDEAFKKSGWAKEVSGGLDVAKQVFLDVSVGGSKVLAPLKASKLGVGAINTAEDAAKAAEDITRAQNGVKNRFTKPLEDFTKNDSTYAIGHPMVKSSANPGLIAHLLGESQTVDDTALILRSALGDQYAMKDLEASRAYMSDALKAARGDIDAVQQYKIFAAPDGSGMLPFLNEDPAVIAEAENNYRSLAKQDKYFADLMEIGQGGGSLTRTTGYGLRPFEDFVAKSRSLKFYDKTAGEAKVDFFQPTPFHRLYQKFSWASGERPAGIVDFNDPDSYKEIIATLQRVSTSKVSENIAGKVVPPSLKKLGLIDETQAKNLLDRYMAASTPEARSEAVLNLENTIVNSMAKKYDISTELMDQIYNNYKGNRMSAMKSIRDKGFMVDTDGSIIKVPVFESQTSNFMPIMDFDLMDRLLRRNASSIKAIGLMTRGADSFVHAADLLQDAFKAGALLRLGYTIRNGVDSQLRIMSAVGSLASLRHLGPGLKNLIFNTTREPQRLIDGYKISKEEGSTVAEIAAKRNSLLTEINDLQKEVNNISSESFVKPNDIDLALKANVKKQILDEKKMLYAHYVDVLERNATKPPKARVGGGQIEHTTADGNTYIIDDALGGKFSGMFRDLISSANTFKRTVDSNTDIINKKISSKGIGIVRPGDVSYFDQWSQTLNRQFGNSAVIKKLANGESVESVSKWLRDDPQGRDLRRRLAIPGDEAADYVTRVNGFFDNYLPITSGLRGKLGEITAGDLRKTFTDPTEMPIIHGHVLETNMNNLDIIKPKSVINGLFHLLGTLPEDAWARHPLYIHMYRKEIARRLDLLEGLKGGEKVSPVEQAQIMSLAHKQALRGMKEVLFNIERKTNLAAAMKYVSPFFSAQENAYKTWMKLAVANPAIVNRGGLIWNSPNKAGMVMDQNGDPVPAGQATMNDTIWLSMPKGVKNIPFVGGGLSSLSEMGIPKSSLDVMFQGGMDLLYNKGDKNVFGDLFPLGPYVSIPISEVAKNAPDVGEAMKWALPYGPNKNVIDGFLPAWLKREQTLQAKQDSPEYARTYELIWKTEQHKARVNGQPPLTDTQVQKMTDNFYKMRIVANLVLPFAPKFDSPYRFYMDKYKEYRRSFGTDADKQFLNDYPDFFDFASSLSQNKTGVQSSVDTVKNIQSNKQLVSDLYNIEPSLVGLIVNNPTGYQFSTAAYDWLYNNKVSAGSKDAFLGNNNPADAQKKNEAKKGWVIYRDIMDSLDQELSQRGLSSTNQKGAEDLKAIKEGVINSLAKNADGTPSAWYNDFKDTDGSKTNRVITGLNKILSDTNFMKSQKNNPTWKSVSVYLDIRKEIAKELSNRDVKSLDAKSNEDVKYVYDAVVLKLKKDDIGFGDLYDRFLSQDLVYDKYLTPKGVK